MGAPGKQMGLRSKDELSERELEVLLLCAQGRTATEQTKILYLANDTIKGYMKTLRAKLGAKSIGEAIYIAVSRGLIPPYEEPEKVAAEDEETGWHTYLK